MEQRNEKRSEEEKENTNQNHSNKNNMIIMCFLSVVFHSLIECFVLSSVSQQTLIILSSSSSLILSYLNYLSFFCVLLIHVT